ncbi:hypothetical protein GALMADRAFT_1116816 [Galerina marginata CBS 339.88]|uniref:Uncharacterized protein n=1 Tax=Galerina marginata (strain CBS 339.88) TaxID=685588 RepID=A0A067TM50_GALM3|nr:hypothetical protein GALMADRAFT_1116816 [Galerina marginata CBS 339.88]
MIKTCILHGTWRFNSPSTAMQLKLTPILFAVGQIVAVIALEARDAPVLTAERIYHTVVDQSPFLVEATTTITWTQSASITDSQPTTAPTASVAFGSG